VFAQRIVTGLMAIRFHKMAMPHPALTLPSAETTIAAFTAVLALSTILLWWETRRLARGAKEQAADFRRSVEAAERSALASQKSADVAERALVGLQRPILVMSIIEYNEAVPSPNQPADSHKVRVRISLENVGVLPGYVESCLAEIRAVERAHDEDLMLPRPCVEELCGVHTADLLEHRVVIRPGEERQFQYNGFVDMSGGVLNNFWGRGRRRLIFFGLLTYGDPLSVTREMGFTYVYSPLAKSEKWLSFDWPPGQSFDRIALIDDDALAPLA
jgi:hypothetical protein